MEKYTIIEFNSINNKHTIDTCRNVLEQNHININRARIFFFVFFRSRKSRKNHLDFVNLSQISRRVKTRATEYNRRTRAHVENIVNVQ